MAESRIMVVDSSAVSREIIARVLRNEIGDVTVTTCASGEQALAVLAGDHYNLVTTSLQLSDMDGAELCQQIRATSSNRYAPVVMICGETSEKQLKQGFSAGVTDYFDKSQGYPAFGKFIKNFCQRHHGLVGRVLYIEDSKTAAAMTLRVMESHGLKVTHVVTAEEGLALMEQMRAGEGEPFDVVVSDLYLKDKMTGRDLLQAIRKRLYYTRQELPVLMSTGNNDSDTRVDLILAGANDCVTKPILEEALMARLRSLLTIKQQFDALEGLANNIQQVAYTDSLTGVRNRRYLIDKGENLLRQAEGQAFWVMIIDIDYLKKINDTMGYLTGDHILAAVGALLDRHFPEAMVVRFGGEEFAVLLSATGREEALRRTEAARAAVAAMQPEGVNVTISMGVAGLDDYPQVNLNALLGIADKALDVAKREGRNSVRLALGNATIVPINEYLVTA